MIVQLSEREHSEVDRGMSVQGTVAGSDLECVLVRADLFERVRYLLDPDPDSGIDEMARLAGEPFPRGLETDDFMSDLIASNAEFRTEFSNRRGGKFVAEEEAFRRLKD